MGWRSFKKWNVVKKKKRNFLYGERNGRDKSKCKGDFVLWQQRMLKKNAVICLSFVCAHSTSADTRNIKRGWMKMMNNRFHSSSWTSPMDRKWFSSSFIFIFIYLLLFFLYILLTHPYHKSIGFFVLFFSKALDRRVSFQKWLIVHLIVLQTKWVSEKKWTWFSM